MPRKPAKKPTYESPLATREERSLILYLESCIVDNGGTIECIRMNEEDFKIAERWHEEGLIQFRPLSFDEIERHSGPRKATHRVAFSEAAWTAAHHARRMRAANNRPF